MSKETVHDDDPFSPQAMKRGVDAEAEARSLYERTIIDDEANAIPVGEVVEVADEVVGPAVQGTALALMDPLKKIELTLATLKEESDAATWDVETTEGEDAARKFRAKCVKVRTSAKAAYEIGNAPLLSAQRDARELVKKIETLVDPIETLWDKKIRAKEERKAAEKAAREQAERERIAAIRRRIEAITASPVRAAACKTSSEIAAILLELGKIAINEEMFGEFEAEADGARMRVEVTLKQLHEVAVGRELDEQRLEAQRQELARQQAELAAQAAAQRAEQERLQREAEERMAEQRRKFDAERAEQQRQAAELKKQQDAFEAERKVAREKLEAEEREREEKRQAELRAIESRQADELAKAVGLPTAAELFGEIPATSAVEPGGDVAAPVVVQPSRPTDEQILNAICQTFQVDERQALVWIDDFNVGNQWFRLDEEQTS